MTDRQPSTRFLVACIGLMIAGTIDVPGLVAFSCGLPFGIAAAEEFYLNVRDIRRRSRLTKLRSEVAQAEVRRAKARKEVREDPTR